MITLYGFGENFGLADPSPFVLKVDVYLRMKGIKFESKGSIHNLQKSPKSKLPYLIDEGHTIADSYFILEHLKMKYGNELDSWLTREQLATCHLIGKSLDENFYWCIVHSRWIDEDTWPLTKHTFFGSMPFPLNIIVPAVAQKDVKKALNKQGLGRHSSEEIKAIFIESLHSLSALLADKQYFMGDKVCSFDATAYAFLAELVLVDFENEFTTIAKKHLNLVAYCQRIHAQYYAAE